MLSLKHSLHRGAGDARGFYLIYCGLAAAAAAVVLIPGSPLGLITEAVQTLAGVLLPSATVFLLLLCNDRAVLGPWVNGAWTNVFTGAVIAILVMLSIVLAASVLYPDIPGEQILWTVGGGCGLALVAAIVTFAMRSPDTKPAIDRALRPVWRMRPLTRLLPARPTGAKRLWMIVLRLYLLVAVGLVVVRVVQLALGE